MIDLAHEWKNFLCAAFSPRFVMSTTLAVGLYIGATTAPSGRVQLLLYALSVFAGSIAGGEFHKRYTNEKTPLEVRNEYSAHVIQIARKHTRGKRSAATDLLKIVEKALEGKKYDK